MRTVTRGRIVAPYGAPTIAGLDEPELDATQLGEHGFAPFVIESIDIEHPAQMVGLVLEDPRQQTLPDELLRLAARIQPAAPDRLEPRRGVVGPGDRQAAFFQDDLSLAVEQLGVRDEQRAVLPVVEHEQLQRDPDLGSREPDAGRLVHRLDHVLREPAQRAIERLDGLGRLAKHRVSQDADR